MTYFKKKKIYLLEGPFFKILDKKADLRKVAPTTERCLSLIQTSTPKIPDPLSTLISIYPHADACRWTVRGALMVPPTHISAVVARWAAQTTSSVFLLTGSHAPHESISIALRIGQIKNFCEFIVLKKKFIKSGNILV
jgi:hypothetical protein